MLALWRGEDAEVLAQLDVVAPLSVVLESADVERHALGVAVPGLWAGQVGEGVVVLGEPDLDIEAVLEDAHQVVEKFVLDLQTEQEERGRGLVSGRRELR